MSDAIREALAELDEPAFYEELAARIDAPSPDYLGQQCADALRQLAKVSRAALVAQPAPSAADAHARVSGVTPDRLPPPVDVLLSASQESAHGGYGRARPVAIAADALPALPPNRLLATISSPNGWDADEKVYGYTAGDMHAYAREAITRSADRSPLAADALPAYFAAPSGEAWSRAVWGTWNAANRARFNIPLYTADQMRAAIAAERAEIDALKSDIANALRGLAEYEAELASLRADAERVVGKTALRCIEMARWPQGVDDEQAYYGKMFAEFIEHEFKAAIDTARSVEAYNTPQPKEPS